MGEPRLGLPSDPLYRKTKENPKNNIKPVVGLTPEEIIEPTIIIEPVLRESCEGTEHSHI